MYYATGGGVLTPKKNQAVDEFAEVCELIEEVFIDIKILEKGIEVCYNGNFGNYMYNQFDKIAPYLEVGRVDFEDGDGYRWSITFKNGEWEEYDEE